jgi:hypothetical protein
MAAYLNAKVQGEPASAMANCAKAAVALARAMSQIP